MRTAYFSGHLCLPGGGCAQGGCTPHWTQRQPPHCMLKYTSPAHCMLGYTPPPVDRRNDTHLWKYYLTPNFVGEQWKLSETPKNPSGLCMCATVFDLGKESQVWSKQDNSTCVPMWEKCLNMNDWLARFNNVYEKRLFFVSVVGCVFYSVKW